MRSYFQGGFEANATTDYFYTRDHLGSVREVVGSDGTTIASRLSYDLWGKATETGSVLPDFGFTGHQFDRATGLGLTWFRGYDPNLGRWLSKDPIGMLGGINLYGYVANRPVDLIDPEGLHGQQCVADKDDCDSYVSACRMRCQVMLQRDGLKQQACYDCCSASYARCRRGKEWIEPDGSCVSPIR